MPEIAEFYGGKSVVAAEWWLHTCVLPQPVWARLRVFNDGSADVCWDEGAKLYGFQSRQYASYFLAEDEYAPFDKMDEEDEREYGIQLSSMTPPVWQDGVIRAFEYLGTY